MLAIECIYNRHSNDKVDATATKFLHKFCRISVEVIDRLLYDNNSNKEVMVMKFVVHE